MHQTSISTIQMKIDGVSMLDMLAQRLAEDITMSQLTDPMMIAWYDGKQKTEHPKVPECQHKPGWLAYAEGHNCKLRVDINKCEYLTIFTDAAIE